jgi:hypothetical protein
MNSKTNHSVAKRAEFKYMNKLGSLLFYDANCIIKIWRLLKNFWGITWIIWK